MRFYCTHLGGVVTSLVLVGEVKVFKKFRFVCVAIEFVWELLFWTCKL